MVATLTTPSTEYLSIPLSGLTTGQPLDFPLYLRTAAKNWVLYRDVQADLDESHIGRLRSEGVEELFIRRRDRSFYSRRVEGRLDQVLKNRELDLEQRSEVFLGVAMTLAQDLWRRQPGPEEIKRGTKLVSSLSTLVLRESGAMAAVRKLMGASQDLALHSLNVSLLCVGLAHRVLGRDPNTLAKAGLAGLLHDLGRVDEIDDDPDDEHASLAAQRLIELQIDPEVCEAVRCHHEKVDGSGKPRGLVGDEIPPLGKLLSIVNTFETIYSKEHPEAGVFDSLRIMAQTYRGCLDSKMASAFVQLFTD